MYAIVKTGGKQYKVAVGDVVEVVPVPAEVVQVEAVPVDVESEPEPEAAPEAVVLDEPGPADVTSAPPRRRRRATSRPAGPPAAS